MDWSELNPDLPSLICDRLEVLQFHRLGAVCRSWRSVVVHYSPHRRRVLAPCLVFTRRKEHYSSATVRFFSLLERRHYSVEQPADPEASGRRHLLGSAFGWVVTIDDENCRIALLNPISRRCIVLPSLFSHDSHVHHGYRVVRVLRYREGRGLVECAEIMWDLPQKAMLSSDPDHEGENWIVVLTLHDTFGDSSQLAYIRQHDPMWTMLNVPSQIHDVICHHGQIYTLSQDRKIATWNFSTSSEEEEEEPRSTTVFSPVLSHTIDPHYNLFIFGYLVPSPNGDFFQVWRWHRRATKKLFTKVFKADFEEQELLETDSLDGHTIFAGRNAPVCVSSHEFLWLRRNCIYFADRQFAKRHLVEIYDVEEDWSVEDLVPLLGDTFCRRPYPIWFMPSLCLNSTGTKGM